MCKRYAVHQIRKSCQFSIQKHDKQIIMAVFIDQNGIKKGKYDRNQLFWRIWLMIMSAWLREFSINHLLVFRPPQITPAR